MSWQGGAMMTRLLLAAALLASAAAAPAAERRFSVTGYDRIRLDGPFEVDLKTNVAPFALASGDQAALDGLKLGVEGRTLVIRASTGAWGGYPGARAGKVVIRLGTHELTTAWINGAGTLAIDKVKGLAFDLAVQGAGSATIADVRVDQFRVGLAGAASARLAGKAPLVTAIVRGTSALDSSGLAVNDMKLGVEGPSVVNARASNSVRIDASGPSTVTITGGAACTVKAAGSATITGC